MDKINDKKKECINRLIKRLKEIRDTNELEEVEVVPTEEVDNFMFANGEEYVILETNISIRHKGLYKKGQWYDDYLYRKI